jgi:anti-sigma regulatory factor (Ser/Thr protein kinase)
VTALRHTVASRAADAGLGGDRLDDFVLAVNELLTNAVRHGGGRGHVALWREPRAVVCEVTDRGKGMPADRTAVTGRPAPDEPGGWGLWLAAELTDAIEVRTGDAGTAVRISTQVF